MVLTITHSELTSDSATLPIASSSPKLDILKVDVLLKRVGDGADK